MSLRVLLFGLPSEISEPNRFVSEAIKLRKD